jgi:hypothetical protein
VSFNSPWIVAVLIAVLLIARSVVQFRYKPKKSAQRIAMLLDAELDLYGVPSNLQCKLIK